MTEPPRCTDRCNRMSASGLCQWCRDRVGRELAAFPELWTELWDSLEPGGNKGDGRGNERTLGVRLEVLSFVGPAAGAGDPDEQNRPDPGDLLDKAGPLQVGPISLPDLLGSWARMAAEDFGYAQRVWTFTTSRDFLVRQHHRICSQPWADDYAAELHEAWRTAMTLTGRWESAQPQPGRFCPWCQAQTLYQRPGEDTYECQERAGGCGRTMLRSEYEQMVRMGAAYLRQSGVV